MPALHNTPPSRYMAAWKPIYWYFTDNRSPNTIAGESAQIIAVQKPNAGQLILYPSLKADDLLVIHGAMLPGVIASGQMVTLSGVSGGVYDGDFRVLQSLANNVTQIDASWVSNETGGTITKLYENFRLVVDAGTDRLRFRLISETRGNDTVFVFPAHLKAQRQLRGSIPATLGYLPTKTTGTVLSCTEPIVTNIPLEVGAEYMVPDKLGNVQVGTFIKPPLLAGADYFAVKAVQPFAGMTPDLEAGPVTYGDNMGNYAVNNTTASDFRLLTDGPTEQRILPGEFASVTAIADWENEPMRFRVNTYDSSGTLIATTNTTSTTYAKGTAIYFPCGPGNLPVAITSSVAYYDVGVNVPSVVVPEFYGNKVVRFHIDRTCQINAFRVFWRNKVGGEDSYTFTGGHQMGTSVDRSILAKDYIEPEFAEGDDLPDYWTERTWRVDPERRFKVETDPIDQTVSLWLGHSMFESADIYTYLPGFDAPVTVIPLGKTVDEVVSSGKQRSRFRLEFKLGTDNLSQRL